MDVDLLLRCITYITYVIAETFSEISAVVVCFSEASEKMLKTWQENEEKADGFTKVGCSTHTNSTQTYLQIFKSSNAKGVFFCRSQMWGIWMKR